MNSPKTKAAIVFIALSALAALFSGCWRAAAADSQPWFVDYSSQAGPLELVTCGDVRRWYIPESNGCGAAWIDYDQDGDIDLFVGNGNNTRYIGNGERVEVLKTTTSNLYRNEFRWKFTNVTKEAGIETSAWVNGIAVGDVDNDGWPEIYLACYGGDVFFKNKRGFFINMTKEAGFNNTKWAASAAFADVDNDGDLDLYVANYCEFDFEHPPKNGARNVINGVEVAWGPEKENPGINIGSPDAFYINDGNGHFHEAANEAGLALPKAYCSYAVVFSDIDNDGKQDILVANDGQPCNLFHNTGNGKFKEEGEIRGFAYAEGGVATSAMGLAVEDFDNDGDFDVFRTNFDNEPNSLHVNDGKGYFTDRAAALGLAAPSVDKLGWACAFVDTDCDGHYEIITVNGHVYPQSEMIGMHPYLQNMQFFELDDAALAKGKFVYRDASAEANVYNGMPATAGRGLAVGDPDNNGSPDLVVVSIDEPPKILKNNRERAGAWISVRLIGSKSSRDGYGARIAVRAGAVTHTREMRATQGLYSSHDTRLAFGLGDISKIDRIEVSWPSGIHQIVESVNPNQFITIREADALPKQKQ
ncbi:MAG: CRTAC1 family protein [Planctomycetes bacterium]|nr:CRTAC1 family protein [Planctomycetota bacterium]